jgi:hypothetical protein
MKTDKPQDAQTQEEFLRRAYWWVRSYSSISPIDIRVARSHLIQQTYKTGRDYRLLDMDFKQFALIMNDKHQYYSRGKYRDRRFNCNSWSAFLPENYRRVRRFIQHGIEIKNKNDKEKKEWRLHKGKVRDWRGSTRKERWHNNIKYMAKTTAKSKHRRWERDTIKQENFDLFHSRSHRVIIDIWWWD